MWFAFGLWFAYMLEYYIYYIKTKCTIRLMYICVTLSLCLRYYNYHLSARSIIILKHNVIKSHVYIRRIVHLV